MVAKGLTLSSSIMEVFIEKRPTLKKGRISLNLFNKKSGSTELISIEYHRDQPSFIFDISELMPAQVGAYNTSVSILDEDGIVVEEAAIKDSVGKIDRLIRGSVKVVIHDFIRVAKNINGSKIFIFKKMYFGENCEECWDEDLDSSNNSNCKTCGGTGKAIQYSQHYVTYGGAIQPIPTERELKQEGMIMEFGPQIMSLPATLHLETDDIIYYQILGTWFIVNSNASAASLKSISSLQTVQMSELPSHAPQVEMLSKRKSFIQTNKGR